jgi:hypothetical protein
MSGSNLLRSGTQSAGACSGRTACAVENLVIEHGGPDNVRHGIWYVSDPGGLFTVEGTSRGTYVLLARADTSQGPLMGIAATDVFTDSVRGCPRDPASAGDD